LFVRFKCQISKKAQAKKREQQCGGGVAAVSRRVAAVA
jgi:hypothetical protein